MKIDEQKKRVREAAIPWAYRAQRLEDFKDLAEHRFRPTNMAEISAWSARGRHKEIPIQTVFGSPQVLSTSEAILRHAEEDAGG